MKELEKTYNPAQIEGRLYEKWLQKKYFHAEVRKDKKPFTTFIHCFHLTVLLSSYHKQNN